MGLFETVLNTPGIRLSMDAAPTSLGKILTKVDFTYFYGITSGHILQRKFFQTW